MMLRTRLAAGLYSLAAAALSPAAPPETRPSKEYSIEQFLATTAISQASFSLDGSKLLFSSDGSGVRNVVVRSDGRRRGVSADEIQPTRRPPCPTSRATTASSSRATRAATS